MITILFELQSMGLFKKNIFIDFLLILDSFDYLGTNTKLSCKSLYKSNRMSICVSVAKDLTNYQLLLSNKAKLVQFRDG